MKQFFKSIPILVGMIALVSCGENKKDQEETKSNISYSYSPENSLVEWTAFKFESKAPVKGTFSKIDVTSISKANDVKTLAESFGFTIPVNSIETLDDSRNAKIIEFFFGTMSTEQLAGRILSLKDDGSAELEVTMNNITGIVAGSYSIIENNFSFKATMDISKWNTSKAIDILNAACKENHTENGVTKVWSEVDLSFTTKLKINN